MEALSPMMTETNMDTSSVAPSPRSSNLMMGLGEESMDVMTMSPKQPDPNENPDNSIPLATAPALTQEGAAPNQSLQTSFTGCLSNVVLPGLTNTGGTGPILINATSPTTVAAPFLLNQSTFTTPTPSAPQFLMNANANPNTTFLLNTNPGNMQTFLLNTNVAAQGPPFMVQTPVSNTTFLMNSSVLNTSPSTFFLTHPNLGASNSTLMLTTANQGAGIPQVQAAGVQQLSQIPQLQGTTLPHIQPAPSISSDPLMDASGEVKGGHNEGGIQIQTVQLPVSLPSAPVVAADASQNLIIHSVPQKSDSRSSSISIPELEQAVVEENSLTDHMEENKDMLALRLKLRRPREELVNQGIMPPLKSTPAFHEQRQRLERAKVGDSLQRKIRMRPDKKQLVHQHILEDTHMEPMVSATHQRLKRARIEQDLDSKIKNRPGPLELIEGNILKADNFVEQVVKDGTVRFLKTTGMDKDDDLFGCDEDSTEGCVDEPMSPLAQPYSQQSDNPPSSVGSIPSPPDFTMYFEQNTNHHQMIPQSLTTSNPIQTKIPLTHSMAPSIMIKQEPNLSSPPPVMSLSGAVSSSSPSSSKSGSSSSSSSKNARKKQAKRNKPKEIKFHEYKPPHEQTSKLEIAPNSSNPYSLLLMQQQLLLQLQLLQQQHHQLILPNAPTVSAPSKLSPSNPGVQSPSSTTVTSSSSPTPMIQQQQDVKVNVAPIKTKILTNLEDMKVSELKMELKNRGLHVSGTKPQLVERLRPYVDVSTSPCSTTTPTSQDVISSSACSLPGGTKVTSSTDIVQEAPSETASNRASMSSPPVSPPDFKTDFKSPVSVVSETSDPASPNSAFESTSPTFQLVPPPSVSHSTTSSSLPVSSPPSIYSQSSDFYLKAKPPSYATTQFNATMMDSNDSSGALSAEMRELGFGDVQVSNEILRKQQLKIEELQKALIASQQQLQQHQTQIMQSSTKTAPPPPPPPPPPHPATFAAAAAAGLLPQSGSTHKLGSLSQAGSTPMTLPKTISPPNSLPISIAPPPPRKSSPINSQSPPKQKSSSPVFQVQDFLSQHQNDFKFSPPLPAGQHFQFSAKSTTETKPTVTNGIISGHKSSSVPSSPTESGPLGQPPSYPNSLPNYEEAVRQSKERKAHISSLLNLGGTEMGEPRMTHSSDIDDLLEVLVDHGYQIPVTPKHKEMSLAAGRLPPHVSSMPNLSLALTANSSSSKLTSSIASISTSNPQLHHNPPPPPPPPHPSQQQHRQHQQMSSPSTPMPIHPAQSPMAMDVDAELGFLDLNKTIPGMSLSSQQLGGQSLPASSAASQSLPGHSLVAQSPLSHTMVQSPMAQAITAPSPVGHSPMGHSAMSQSQRDFHSSPKEQQHHNASAGMLSSAAAVPAVASDKDNSNILWFDIGMHVDGDRDPGTFSTLGGDEPSSSTGMLGQPQSADSDMNWLDMMMSSGSDLSPGTANEPNSSIGGADGFLGNALGKDSLSLNLFDTYDDPWDSIHVTE